MQIFVVFVRILLNVNLCWIWVFPWIKLSWHSGSMWNKLDDSFDFDSFSVTGYLPLIQKDSITHIHGLAVYVKEGLPFAGDFSLENSTDSYRSNWLYYAQCLIFFLSWSPSLSLCLVFGSISSNMDEVLSINPGLSMNILCTGNKLLLQRGFFKNSAGHLLLALRFLGGLYNFHHFVIIFSLLLVMMMCSRRATYFTDSKMI